MAVCYSIKRINIRVQLSALGCNVRKEQRCFLASEDFFALLDLEYVYTFYPLSKTPVTLILHIAILP